MFDIVATSSGLIDCVTVSCFLEFQTTIFNTADHKTSGKKYLYCILLWCVPLFGFFVLFFSLFFLHLLTVVLSLEKGVILKIRTFCIAILYLHIVSPYCHVVFCISFCTDKARVVSLLNSVPF